MKKVTRLALATAIAASVVSAAVWMATGRHYYTKFEIVETVEAPVDPADPLTQAGFYDGGSRTETVRRPGFHLGLLPTPSGLLDKHALSVLSLTAPFWLVAAGFLFLDRRRRAGGRRPADRPGAKGVPMTKRMKSLSALLWAGAIGTTLLAVSALPADAAARGGGGHERAMNPCGGKQTTRFVVDDPMGRNTVTFKSEAPLEDIVGTTNEVSGWIEFDPAHPDHGARGELVVPVASLETGIPLRDEHLRSADWLDAKRHPEIKLEIDGVERVKTLKRSRDFTTFAMDVNGKIWVHGRYKRVSFPVRVTYLPESEKTRQKRPGDLLAGRGGFTVRLADFGVEGPSGAELIGSKVGEEIKVDVSLVASNRAASAMNPCGGKSGMNPCGGKAGMNPCGGKSGMNPCGGKSGMNPCGGR